MLLSTYRQYLGNSIEASKFCLHWSLINPIDNSIWWQSISQFVIFKSNTALPSAGSVTFWVATAPTPARTQGQRLPTQILDVVIETPNIPVRSQWPTSENVMSNLVPAKLVALARDRYRAWAASLSPWMPKNESAAYGSSSSIVVAMSRAVRVGVPRNKRPVWGDGTAGAVNGNASAAV